MPKQSRWARSTGTALTFALLVLAGSCRDAPTAPRAPSNGAPPSGFIGLPGLFGSPRLLYCPSNESQQTSAILGINGGTLSLGGTTVTLPVGALLQDQTSVELSIPAGRYMEVDLTVNGGQHMTFPQPIVVTIDYSRCNRLATLLARLSVWNIDPDTKALLENMGGIDNKLTRSITFTTPHFSGFAIAY
jgi:hypothetical protein